MYQKQVNKTAVQSQHMIADALLSLMKRKHFQQITVTEICQEAAVGRKTFYRNFDTREDVLKFKLDLLCIQYQAEILGMPLDEQLRHHMIFVKKHSEFFIAMYHNGLDQMVRNRFAILLPVTMPKWTEDPVEQEYRSRYIIAGVEAVERVWVERGFAESVEQVVQIVRNAHERQIPIL